MASQPSSMNLPSPGLKTYFKTPEGRYKLQYEKTHPAGLLHYSHGKSVSQLTIAYLKEKPASHGTSAPSTPSSNSVVNPAAAKLFVGVNGSKAFSFGGTNGGSKTVVGNSRLGWTFGASAGSSTSPAATNFDGKGSYLVFNAGDTLFISDLDSQDKDIIKGIHFSNSNPLCHAFDSEVKEGHDLIIGLLSGDVGVLVLHGYQMAMVFLLLLILMETYTFMKKIRMGLLTHPFLLSKIQLNLLFLMHGPVRAIQQLGGIFAKGQLTIFLSQRMCIFSGCWQRWLFKSI